MKYKTQKDLYLALLPVLEVKKRINKYYGYSCDMLGIWNYLGKNKWAGKSNLMLYEVVNDIISLDMIDYRRKMMVNE